MFSKDTYIKRRKELKELVGSGVIIILATTNRLAISLITGMHLFDKTLRSCITSDKTETDWLV